MDISSVEWNGCMLHMNLDKTWCQYWIRLERVHIKISEIYMLY